MTSPSGRRYPTRRQLLMLAGGLALFQGARYGHQRVSRAAPPSGPLSAAAQTLIAKAWAGLQPSRVLDTHVHLLGAGETGSGCYVNPRLTSPTSPLDYLKFTVYQAASGVTDASKTDTQYAERLLELMKGQSVHGRLLLLAFDQFHDERGQPVPQESEFYTPNEYALSLAARWPQYFAACASVHPYRPDAIDAIERAAAHGAVAVKWLPNAMNIDLASPKCDAFYDALARLQLPLITHTGEEKAVRAEARQRLGNPLLLRRPLERGVTVVAAHCASLGQNPDLDAPGEHKPLVDNFELFLRLMAEPQWRGRLWGELSAMTLANRVGASVVRLLTDEALSSRLINGSDYPLPAINALMRTGAVEEHGLITAEERTALNDIDRHDPLLFDFVLKRTLRVRRDGREYRLPDDTFMVRPSVFARLA